MGKNKPIIVSSHWSTMIEGLELSPSVFFTDVKAAIESKQIPEKKDLEVQWREGGILSAKRTYLRVKRQEIAFDICGAPFGNGFFVSWWGGEIPSGWLSILYMIPFLSWIAALFERFFRTETYYKVDTRSMFQALVNSAVQEVVEMHIKAKGLRALTTDERKPVMKDFFSGK